MAPAVSVAVAWGWGIGMVVCMLMMGVMMFAMIGHGRARDSRPRSWSDRWPGSQSETPTDVLERRFAEGEISVEEYRKRREILAHGTVTQDPGDQDQAPTAPSRTQGRQ